MKYVLAVVMVIPISVQAQSLDNAAPMTITPDMFTSAIGSNTQSFFSPSIPISTPPPVLIPSTKKTQPTNDDSTTLTPPTPIQTTNSQLTILPFAQNNCAGQTLFADFSNGIGKWSVGGGGSLSDGNDAFASYQGNTMNASIATAASNGLTLKITPSDSSAPNGAAWLAGLINSQNFFSQTYGYFEAVYDLPNSMEQPGGSWAFWLIGYVWPPEIDIAEMYGSQFDAAVHSADPNFKPGPNGEPPRKHTDYNPLGVSNPVLDQYGENYHWPPGTHVAATSWDAKQIKIYSDGLLIAQSDTPSDFHQPMYIVLGSAATHAMQPGASASVNIKQVRVFKDEASAMACIPNNALTSFNVNTKPPNH